VFRFERRVGDRAAAVRAAANRGCVSAAFLLASVLAAGSSKAQAPYLVKDINPAAPDRSADLTSCYEASVAALPSRGLTFFRGSSGNSQSSVRGFWVSNGTSEGTFQLLEGSVLSGQFAALDGNLFFVNNGELWKSDGSLTGTSRVWSPPWPPPTGPDGIYDLTATSDRVYFTFADSTHGRELWTSDGTEAGTQLVVDLVPGASGFFGAWSGATPRLVALGLKLFFTCGEYPGPGCGLWTSDGTPAGTFQVKEIPFVTGLAAAGGAVFVTASESNAVQLWRSDGTEVGTVLVKEFPPPPGGRGFA
jgi:ELWxxDGT repeat protein